MKTVHPAICWATLKHRTEHFSRKNERGSFLIVRTPGERNLSTLKRILRFFKWQPWSVNTIESVTLFSNVVAEGSCCLCDGHWRPSVIYRTSSSASDGDTLKIERYYENLLYEDQLFRRRGGKGRGALNVEMNWKPIEWNIFCRRMG